MLVRLVHTYNEYTVQQRFIHSTVTTHKKGNTLNITTISSKS